MIIPERAAMLKMTCQILLLGSPLLLVAIAQGLCIRYDWVPSLRRPMDMGLKFRGKRIFGDHKTWRGLVINIIFCTLGTIILTILLNMDFIPYWLPMLDYNEKGILLGILLGLGMTLGELPNSFIKRQLNISPGKKHQGLLGAILFLYDQIDLTIGIWIFIYFIIRPSLLFIIWSFIFTIILHVAISSVGYMLGMRKTLF